MATTSSLLLIVYAPTFGGDDERPIALTHAMEHAYPGLCLEWTISDEGRFNLLPQRDAWIRQEGLHGGLPLLCNGDEDHLVTLSGWECPAGSASGRQAQFEVHAELPLDAVGIEKAAAVLVGIAENVRALWGHATPEGAALDIALQTSPTVGGPPRPPRGLPALQLPETFRLPEIPHRLGWLNYWSAVAARTLGFPDPARDADLLSRASRTPEGGWVVRLTDEPLDLDRPAHLKALLRAYERFPAVGGRSTD